MNNTAWTYLMSHHSFNADNQIGPLKVLNSKNYFFRIAKLSIGMSKSNINNVVRIVMG